MSLNPRVLDLLLRWEERCERGEPLSLEELCRDCPELLPEVRQRIQELGEVPAPSTVYLPGDDEPRRACPGPPGGADDPGRLGPYRVLRLLGHGGMGEVYVADDADLRRQVAVKRLRPSAAGHAERRRFLREAEITGSLEHPGVVPVYGLTRDAAGWPSYAMRLVKGRTLQEAIRRLHDPGADQGPPGLLLRQLLNRFVAVCNTIAYAHSRGVIHRDLKPANILLGDYGETLVVDWGLAKRLDLPGETQPADGDCPPPHPTDGREDVTAPGDVLGTPAFMSPEQAAGRHDAVGPASDVYGLGATLYALLTARPPFGDGSVREVLQKVERGDFPPPRQLRPDTPRALEAICLKAMARQPAARYATALELAEDVERWLADEPVRACREPLRTRARRWLRRHRTPVTALAVLLTTAVAAGGLGTVLVGRERAKTTALGRVEALRAAAPAAVPVLLDNLNLSDAEVLPRLRQLWEEEDLPEDQRRRVGLALLPADSGVVRSRLITMMLEEPEPNEALLLRDGLAPYAAESRAELWAQLRQPATSAPRQFRLLIALAAFDPTSENWPGVADQLAEQLLDSNPLHRGTWAEALRPVRQVLIAPLSKAVRQARATDRGLLAATILAEFAADNPAVLVEALLEAGPEQYAVLWPKLRAHPDTPIAARAREELDKPAAAGAPDAALDALASRQANAAVTLVKLGRSRTVWPLLRSGPAPRLRSYLVHRFAALRVEPEELLQQLWAEQDTSVRQALLLSLGEYAGDQFPSGLRQELRAKLSGVYREDPDPGIHSAVDWLLRRLGGGEDVLAAERQLVSAGPMRGRRWYANGEGHTMVVVPGPVTFPMRHLDDTGPAHLIAQVFAAQALAPAGPPLAPMAQVLAASKVATSDAFVLEAAPDAAEVLETRRIPYSFALASKEVTLKQFRRFLRANPTITYEFTARVSPDEKGPATQVTWIHAAQYCRWLSEQEHTPEKEMCFPAIKDIKEGMKLPADYKRRTGYRLPTEEEWECACRTGTVTSRAYGSADELLKYYGWHLDNGGKRTWPVGLLKPNDWGLFDTYGNVEEWCMDEYRFSLEVEERVLRGSGVYWDPEDVRTAPPLRYSNRPTYRGNECGMRLARTLPESGAPR
jgi:serine/threonine protein kinase/formylglycine-generating enzyme required for sulfatase activity